MPPTRLSELAGAASTVGWIAVVVAAVKRWRSLGGWVTGWFVLSLAIAANVAFPIGTIFAERLAYLASVGVAVSAAAALSALVRWRSSWMRPACAALLGVLAIRTAVRNLDFASEERLFRAAVQACPTSIIARYNLAVFVSERGALGEALENLDAALDVYPNWPTALAARGRVRWVGGDRGSAARDFQAALAAEPSNPAALAGLGDVARVAGDCARALPYYEAALLADRVDRIALAGREACSAAPR